MVAAQAEPPDLDEIEELVFNVTLNGYEGLCNACIFSNDASIYMTNSPYCTITWF